MGESVSRPTDDSADSPARFRDSRCGLVPSGYYPLGRPADFLAFSLLNY
jgi:hypothetical protein